MKIKKSWLGSVLLAAILIFAGYAIFLANQSEDQPDVSSGGEYQINPNYPKNLIEGAITSIELNPPQGTFGIEVNMDKIFLEEISLTKEVTLLIDEEAKFFFFNLETREEMLIKMEDFKVGDQVIIATSEGNSEILTRDTFTGLEMKNMFLPF